MASKWRIRHKLMIGLGLVVGVSALSLAGTLKGLASYRASMNSVESKLGELKSAQELSRAVTDLSAGDAGEGCQALRRRLQSARTAFEEYQKRLQETLELGRDPEGGYDEIQWVTDLAESFGLLAKAIDDFAADPFKEPDAPTDLRRDAKVERAIKKLMSSSNDLEGVIYRDLGNRIIEARENRKGSLVVVITSSVLGVLLMAGLLRFFYGWVSSPLRDLQQGAGRIAQGDFGQRIDIHSGDEMEDLAVAFNHMTERLEMIYADLARQVNERSRQLVRSERLASVGFLAAGVAHEINNPLASIAFCSEALEARVAELLAGKVGQKASSGEHEVITRYLRLIQQEAFRCKEITERLLEFSRGGERRREPVDLGEIVQSVLDMVAHLQNARDKEIVWEQPEPIVAWVNGQEIKSVVLNLVVNALDSMEERGRLTIELSEKEGMAVLEFHDTGCGMSAEVLENIFEPFFTRSRTGKGTGLGLTISHRIINQHGGEIEAASPGSNQGSTFIVRLPLQPAEPVKEESLGHAAA